MPPDEKDKAASNSWNEGLVTTRMSELSGADGTSADELLNRATAHDPAFIIVQGELIGKVFRFPEGISQIGRSPDNAIVLPLRGVSGRHAQVRREGRSVIVEDLGSTNGTTVNLTRISAPCLLRQNDLVKLGTCVFRYSENLLETSFTESLHQKGTTDELTGVYNKGFLTNALTSAIDVARTGYPLSVVIFDLDHFKQINDTFGHVAGDYVLKEASQLIDQKVLRSGDVFGRWGGEEFLVILADAKLEVAVGVAERIRHALQAHAFVFSGKTISVTASFGVAAWDVAHASVDGLIESADKQLYVSKRGGRNRVSALQA